MKQVKRTSNAQLHPVERSSILPAKVKLYLRKKARRDTLITNALTDSSANLNIDVLSQCYRVPDVRPCSDSDVEIRAMRIYQDKQIDVSRRCTISMNMDAPRDTKPRGGCFCGGEVRAGPGRVHIGEAKTE
mmetsp:Transcript_109879/g.311624  ORF Transcript_109879/g.311624 Transcript_109879/m.311624 type:complete len:131 (-) Transcript_109879:1177-1569(-)